MNIEIINKGIVTIVKKDGEEVGTMDGGAFLPVRGLHHKTVKAIEDHIEEINAPHQAAIPGGKERKGPYPVQPPDAPEQDPKAGDKTPAYVEWFRANHSEEEFRAKYAHRKIS